MAHDPTQRAANDDEVDMTSPDFGRAESASEVAVVTGGRRGIGRATAERFLEEGLTVVVASRSAEALIIPPEWGGRLFALPVDITSEQSCEALFARVSDELGVPSILVNNAGAATNYSTLGSDSARWHEDLAVNLTGTYHCCRAFAAGLDRVGKGGAIVNISSIAAVRAVRPEVHAGYDVAKAGVSHLTRVLAAEWVDRGIRVNAVAPGYTGTELLSDLAATDPAALAMWIAHVPQKRLITPEEVADAVAFLASDRATAITGQILTVDGGYTLI